MRVHNLHGHTAEKHRRKRWRAKENASLCVSAAKDASGQNAMRIGENWKAHRLCICLQKVQNINSILQRSMYPFQSNISCTMAQLIGSFSPPGHQEKTRAHTHSHLHLHRPPILHFMLKCSSRLNSVFIQLYQNSIQRNCLLPDSRSPSLSHSRSLSLSPRYHYLSTYFSLMFTSRWHRIYTQYLFLGTLKRLNSGVMRVRVQHYMAWGGEPDFSPSFLPLSSLILPLQHLIQE